MTAYREPHQPVRFTSNQNPLPLSRNLGASRWKQRTGRIEVSAARDVPARDRPLLSSEPSFGRKANREPGRIGTWAGKREFRKVRRAVENTQSPVPTFGKIRNAHT